MTQLVDRPDGRRERGDATRRIAARRAAEIATVTGLDSISVGQLATETGLSKSGILTVFGSRENIQIGAVAEARRIFIERVITGTREVKAGKARLAAMLRAWASYQKSGIFPGGCFLAATSVEYGHRDGPVADSIRRLKREWLGFLESEFDAAGAKDPAAAAFQVDAFLCAANTRHQLFADSGDLDRGLRMALEVVERA